MKLFLRRAGESFLPAMLQNLQPMLIDCSNCVSMTERSARQIVEWIYDPPYERYNIEPAQWPKTIELMMNPLNHYFAVCDEKGTPFAFYCFGPEAQVSGGNYSREAIDIGGGLIPNMTGRGYGEHFLLAGLKFGRSLFPGSVFRATVLESNIRSRKVCSSVGFIEIDRFSRPSDNAVFVLLECNRAEPFSEKCV